MTYVIRMEEMADALEQAAKLLEFWGSGLAISRAADKARQSAELFRERCSSGETKIPVSTLEDGQTALRLAHQVLSVVNDDSEYPDFDSHADTLGVAIWGSAPKKESARILPERRT